MKYRESADPCSPPAVDDVAAPEAGLEVLHAAQARGLARHHDDQAVTQCLTLLLQPMPMRMPVPWGLAI